MQKHYNLLLAGLLTLFLLGCNTPPPSSETNTAEIIDDPIHVLGRKPIESRKTTDIYAYMNAPIKEGRSSIYCASFQLAWDVLRDEVLKEDPKIIDAPEWVEYLNASSAKGVIDSAHFVARAGITKGSVSDIVNTTLQEQFGMSYTNTRMDAVSNLPKLYAFGYLKKSMKYAGGFGYSGGVRFQDEYVPSFGWKKILEATKGHETSLSIYDYQHDNDFIVKLHTKMGEGEIILAKVPPKTDLKSTYESVMKRCKAENESFVRTGDVFKVPYLNFCVMENFPELRGRKLLNDQVKNSQIEDVLQLMLFSMDDDGVAVKAFTLIAGYAAEEAEVRPKEERKLVFDKPYLLILKEKASQNPYFLMWVGSSEFMSRGE